MNIRTDIWRQMMASAVLCFFVMAVFAVPGSAGAWAQEAEGEPETAEEAKPDAAKSDEAEEDEKTDAKDEDEEEEEDPTLEETVEDYEKIEGLFTFYRNKEDGGLLMEVSEAQMAEGVEFIYHSVVRDGAAEAGYTRGNYQWEKMIRFSRYYDRIEIRMENTSFYFDPESALSRASDANIQPALLVVSAVMAKSEDGTRYLIDADSIFQGEGLSQISRSPDPNPEHRAPNPFNPGDINSDKTRITKVSSYPRNSTVQVDFVFDNPTPTNYGGQDITDGRTFTVSYLHSLIAAPEPGFEPRFDDQRVGYFFNRVTDLTDASVTPYRDVINRWRLVKKDPDAELSEPVEPIVYWIENTTPLKYRDAVAAGVVGWNSAFEKAGFKNALVVKIQPDDADWDAGDIDYNVVQWMSSPNNGGTWGYGPSLASPRTGEIIATDIVLEHSFAIYHELYDDLFAQASLAPMNSAAHPGTASKDKMKNALCSYGSVIRSNTMFAAAALRAEGATSSEVNEIMTQGLQKLVLHEVGHTLGLSHNFKASQTVAYEDLQSEKVKQRGYIEGSVMDYVPVNLSSNPKEQGLYYSVKPGPYDDWAIEYGYRPSLSDAQAEEERVATLLSQSTEEGLTFGNDADAIVSPRTGIDPRITIYDMSDNAVQYASDVMVFTDIRMGDLKSTFAKPGESWDELRYAYLTLTGEKSSQARVVAGYIGGIYMERSVIGQEGAKTPYVPVERAVQRQAMEILTDHIFAPDAWDVPEELIQHLQAKRRGFDHWRKADDPQMHDRILGIQSRVVDRILFPKTMQRMLDSTLYGNKYPPADVLQDLTDAIFKADLKGPVNSYRQNLQLHYVQQLMTVATGSAGHSFALQSLALYQLRRIEKMERQAKSRDIATSAHRTHVRFWIEQALYGQASRM